MSRCSQNNYFEFGTSVTTTTTEKKIITIMTFKKKKKKRMKFILKDSDNILKCFKEYNTRRLNYEEFKILY